MNSMNMFPKKVTPIVGSLKEAPETLSLSRQIRKEELIRGEELRDLEAREAPVPGVRRNEAWAIY